MQLNKILSLMDPGDTISDYSNTLNHVLIPTYRATKFGRNEIKKWVSNNTEPYAYAHNPGNAVVVFRTKVQLIAFSITYEGYPDRNRAHYYHWSEVDPQEAIRLIRNKSDWKRTSIPEDLHKLEDITKRSGSWEQECLVRIYYHKSCYDNDKNVRIYCRNMRIHRLKSGRLRCEVDGYFRSITEFGRILQKFKESIPDNEELNFADLDFVARNIAVIFDSADSVRRIQGLNKDLVDEIIAQSVKDKLFRKEREERWNRSVPQM